MCTVRVLVCVCVAGKFIVNRLLYICSICIFYISLHVFHILMHACVCVCEGVTVFVCGRQANVLLYIAVVFINACVYVCVCVFV